MYLPSQNRSPWTTTWDINNIFLPVTGGGGGACLVGDLNCRLFARASATIVFEGLGGTGGGGLPPILCPLFGRIIVLGHNTSRKHRILVTQIAHLYSPQK